jgi:hypothetical protein
MTTEPGQSVARSLMPQDLNSTARRQTNRSLPPVPKPFLEPKLVHQILVAQIAGKMPPCSRPSNALNNAWPLECSGLGSPWLR